MRFPREVYAFYDEGDIETMLAAAAFDSMQFSRIGEYSLVLATSSAIRADQIRR
jgi:hypothetical protein